MSKNGVKYVQGVSFSQLAVAKKIESKNLGVSQSSSSRIQTYVWKSEWLFWNQRSIRPYD
jgi:hypothetical protein